MDEKITLAVLGQKLDDLIKSNKEAHIAVLEQTMRTNGRVSALEKWQNRLIGGWIVLTVIVIPLAIGLMRLVIK